MRYNLTPSVIIDTALTASAIGEDGFVVTSLDEALHHLAEQGVDAEWLEVLRLRGSSYEG